MLEARAVYAAMSSEPGEPGAESGDQTVRARRPDLVVVGAASRDVTDHDPRGWRLGGPAAYCSLAAARLGLRVGCLMGVDPLAATAGELGWLACAGIDLRRVALDHGPVFENIEIDGHRRQRWLSKSDIMPVAVLPDEWRGAAGWLLVPVASELGDDWAAVPALDAHVGLGWQGLLRDFDADGWVERREPAPSPLLGRAAVVCASVDDLLPNVDLADLRRCAAAATIVLTAGPRGGMAVQGSRLVLYSAVPADATADATGAGDVFLATLMAAWLATGELATSRSLRFAAAAGSLAVEEMGLAGVPTRAAVAARLERVAAQDRSRA